MNCSKKVVSMIMVVCLIISMMPTMAFAETNEKEASNKLSYVALGDSMS